MGRGFGITSSVAHDVVRQIASEAERLGYSSLWVNDTPGADGLASLAVAAEVTTRIALGVGVVPLDRRPAASIVEQVRSMDLPMDRLIVGVGSGEARDALALVRAGAPAVREELGAQVVVGALGPKMAALGGEVADGVLLNWVTPDHAQRVGRGVLDAAERAQRSPRPSITAYVRCALLPQAGERMRKELAMYETIPQFQDHVARMGVDALDSCVLGEDADAMQRGVRPFESVLDEAVVRAITPNDDLDSLQELLRACAP